MVEEYPGIFGLQARRQQGGSQNNCEAEDFGHGARFKFQVTSLQPCLPGSTEMACAWGKDSLASLIDACFFSPIPLAHAYAASECRNVGGQWRAPRFSAWAKS